MSPKQLFEIKPVPGKGLGMIATTDIPQGSRLLAEKPLVVFTQARDIHDADGARRFRDSIINKVRSLDSEAQKTFFGLCNAWESLEDEEDSFEDRCMGVVRTNNMPMATEDPIGNVKRGIFPTIARINHSCNQNCQAYWNENIGKYTVQAGRDIYAGEEITLYYLPTLGTYEHRRLLCTHHNFRCTCEFCCLKGIERDSHDALIRKALDIEVHLSDDTMLADEPDKFIRPVSDLIDTLSEAKIWHDLGARAWYDAFRVACYHGDTARAKVFVSRAHTYLDDILGSDHLRTIKMKRLVVDPTKGPDFGKSKLWATTLADTPRNLTPEKIESWLWRKEGPKPVADITPDSLTKDKIANLREFPAYHLLPARAGTDPDGTFYRYNRHGEYKLAKHWCFFGEIVSVDKNLRVALRVKDRMGTEVLVIFMTDERGMSFYDFLKPDNTIAILYAVRHRFAGTAGIDGIILNKLDAVRIFPISLEGLMDLNDKVHERAVYAGDKKQCHACGKEPKAVKTCGRCSMAWYCDRVCQVKAWAELGHKKECKLLGNRNLRGLFLRDWRYFEEYEGFE